MTAPITFDDLSQTAVDTTLQLLTAIVGERHPELLSGAGGFYDLVLGWSAVCQAVSEAQLTRYEQSGSVAAILANPDAADPEIVDAVFSNFGVSRLPGASASGLITLVFTANVSVVLTPSLRFAAGASQYKLQSQVIARPAGTSITAAYERALVPRGDGTYAITLPAVATTAGVSGNIRRGAILSPITPMAQLATAYASADFVGGQDGESNSDLAARARFGSAAKIAITRDGITAAVRSQSGYEHAAVSVVGAFHAAMLRSKRGLWPIARHGFTDVYVRTRRQPAETLMTAQASLISIEADASVWQVTLPAAAADGVYLVTSVLTATGIGESCEILSDSRDCDTSGAKLLPTRQDYAFTAFQTLTVVFRDTVSSRTGLQVGDTRSYQLVLLQMPGISATQSLLDNDQTQAVTTDLVVRAPLPCFVHVAIEIDSPHSEPLDTAAIRQAIADTINASGFRGLVTTAQALQAVSPLLTASQLVTSIEMSGQLLQASGGYSELPWSSHSVRVPDWPDAGVSPQTVALFGDTQRVYVTVRGGAA